MNLLLMYLLNGWRVDWSRAEPDGTFYAKGHYVWVPITPREPEGIFVPLGLQHPQEFDWRMAR